MIFLNPRKSQVDIVQSVGRVMRKTPGKKYGYIILPVAIPAGASPEEALADNDRFRVVWEVLQALRAHDERFDAMINKIELNKNKPDKLIFVQTSFDSDEGGASCEGVAGPNGSPSNSRSIPWRSGATRSTRAWSRRSVRAAIGRRGRRTSWASPSVTARAWWNW